MRTFATFIAFVGLLGLGCTRENPDQAGVGKDGTLRVVSAQASHSAGAAGVMLVNVDLVLVNHGLAELPLQAKRFSVQTTAGIEFSGSILTGTSSSGCVEGAGLADGSTVECLLAFEVPPPGATRALEYTMPDLSTLSVPLTAPCIDCSTPSMQPDPSMQPSPGEICNNPASCGSGSYSLCTASGPSCSMRYLTSDGLSFACSSCTDCQAAASKVADWCNGNVPTPTTPSGDAACAAMSNDSECGTCCQTNHPAGASRWLSLLAACECTNPGDCSFECAATFCTDQTTADSLCDACIQSNVTSGGDCDVSNSCNSDASCAPYLSCINACP